MASTLIEQLTRSLADARELDARGVELDLLTLEKVVRGLVARDTTIAEQDTRHRALIAKLRGVMLNDTATVPSKMQLIRRAIGMAEPR